MGDRLSGRVALVTGGSRGIGRGIALRLGADGAAVAVVYRREADAATEVVEKIRADGGSAAAFSAAVDDPEQDAALVDEVTRELGAPDILVHSAGIASRGRSVADTDPAEPARLINVHAIAAHHLSRLLIPGMRERERGDIVLISSVAGSRPSANGAPYNMAKAAMEALAATLAQEERGNGIRVNVVAPGLVVTEMGDRLARATAGVADAAALDSRHPLGRVCRPEDIADVVSFLVSTPFVVGERIIVDGGESMSRRLIH